jgi:hypothetical protein
MSRFRGHLDRVGDVDDLALGMDGASSFAHR